MTEYSKQYKTQLEGSLRKDFEDYISNRGVSKSEALRECIKSHVRNKQTTPDIQTRLRSIEIELRELNRKL